MGDLYNKLSQATVEEAQEVFVELRKMTTKREADILAKQMGFKGGDDQIEEEAGASLVGMWTDTDKKVEKLPPDVRKEGEMLGDIAVFVHGRMFNERAMGFVSHDGKRAYVPETEYEELV